MRVSNSLDPDQTRPFVRPDLGPNCLQRLSADDISRQRVKVVNSNNKGIELTIFETIYHNESLSEKDADQPAQLRSLISTIAVHL